MNAAVIVFPGSNCDRDVAVSLEAQLDERAPTGVVFNDEHLPSLGLGRFDVNGRSALGAHAVRPGSGPDPSGAHSIASRWRQSSSTRLTTLYQVV